MDFNKEEYVALADGMSREELFKENLRLTTEISDNRDNPEAIRVNEAKWDIIYDKIIKEG